MRAGVTLFFVLALFYGYVASDEEVKPEYIENVKQDEAARNSRIVSGWEAVPGMHPHQVSLRIISVLGQVFGCGGSVVSRQWVITSAHCTASRVTVVVRAGVTNLTNPEYIAETSEWYNHPTFNEATPSVVQPNDICLLKLWHPVVYTDNLRAIRIQSTADAYRNYADELLYASGFGLTWTGGFSTEVLNWVYLRGVSNTECFLNFLNPIITDTTICARFFNVTSQSICQGDSGGPLVHVDSEGEPTLIGVSSFVAGGNIGCHSGFPAGFCRPGPFHSWFTEVSGIDFENLVEEEETTTPSITTTTTPTPPATTTTEAPEEEEEEESPEESEEDDDEEDLSELLKRLEVKVKVKVRLSKYRNKKILQEITAE